MLTCVASAHWSHSGCARLLHSVDLIATVLHNSAHVPVSVGAQNPSTCQCPPVSRESVVCVCVRCQFFLWLARSHFPNITLAWSRPPPPPVSLSAPMNLARVSYATNMNTIAQVKATNPTGQCQLDTTRLLLRTKAMWVDARNKPGVDEFRNENKTIEYLREKKDIAGVVLVGKLPWSRVLRKLCWWTRQGLTLVGILSWRWCHLCVWWHSGGSGTADCKCGWGVVYACSSSSSGSGTWDAYTIGAHIDR